LVAVIAHHPNRGGDPDLAERRWPHSDCVENLDPDANHGNHGSHRQHGHQRHCKTRNAQKETARRGEPSCYLRIGVARLVERLFGISIVLARSLALLARFRAAALLLTGLLTRRLILLAGLVLVRHVVSFHGNTITTARSPRRSHKRKWQFASAKVSRTYSG
jgi:hypothetical protein